MFFVTEKEELKPCLILFRRAAFPFTIPKDANRGRREASELILDRLHIASMSGQSQAVHECGQARCGLAPWSIGCRTAAG
jgi:hypothetical protein